MATKPDERRPPAPLPTPRKPAEARAPGVLLGVALTGLLHVVAYGAAALVNATDVMYFVGVVQIVYVGPALAVLVAKKKKDLTIGLVIGAALTFISTPLGCLAALNDL